MPKKRKSEGPILSQKAWGAWKMFNEAAKTSDATQSFREQAEAALEAGRATVLRDMLDVRDEFLTAARAEFKRAEQKDEDSAVHRGMGLVFLSAAGSLRTAAQLASRQAPAFEDARLLKILNGGLD